ncbi:MAG: hypothetical protein A2046_04865 [Bacteroidetes bacterium GWA2_30_7]|nr:MAG: hypothetical protein A2046_04865 [Bacteroidetes bacterium GWA2_30_7]
MEVVIRITDKKAINSIVEAIKSINGVKQLFFRENINSKPIKITTDRETSEAIFCTSSTAFSKYLDEKTSDIF